MDHIATRFHRNPGAHDDGLDPLPAAKHTVFRELVRELNSGCAMVGVALDQSFALRNRALLGCARDQAGVAAELLRRLGHRLHPLLAELARVPAGPPLPRAVAPLQPGHFRSEAGRRIALASAVLHVALPHTRLRLKVKVCALRSLAAELNAQFLEAAAEIAEGTSIHPARDWQRLTDLLYDLNACLAEVTALFRSFLAALPAGDLAAFRRRLEAPAALLAPQPGLYRAST